MKNENALFMNIIVMVNILVLNKSVLAVLGDRVADYYCFTSELAKIYKMQGTFDNIFSLVIGPNP